VNRNILICPLEWGLGHAARIIPLALRLKEKGFTIIAGSGEMHLALLRSEIPGIRCISFPGFRPKYSRSVPQYLFLILQVPSLIWHSIREHFRLKRIISENEIDIVISDNRFGLWNKNIVSVYITHQPRIPFPGPFKKLEFVGEWLHRLIISRYTYCFIPDLPGELNLTGRLAHELRIPANAMYIGILSRLTGIESRAADMPVPAVENTIILSGPEPQKSILKKKLTDFFSKTSENTVVLGGEPGDDSLNRYSGNIVEFNHLPPESIKELFLRSRTVISRSGYTTIMELVSLGCNAVLIPTPGQTEQEYLARLLCKKGWFASVSQKEAGVFLPVVPEKSIPYKEINEESRQLLESALQQLLQNK